jgi:hypothetical protein
MDNAFLPRLSMVAAETRIALLALKKSSGVRSEAIGGQRR